MAQITDTAGVLDDPRDSTVAVDQKVSTDELDELKSWVLARINLWRNHRRTNYEGLWDVYERLWRSMWTEDDKSRKSERSNLVTPGLAEAVENIVAEVEEALFGRGDSFDMKAAFGSNEDAKKITDENKARLKEDLGTADFNPNIGEALINGAVYGSGIGEILVETFMKREIAASVAAAVQDIGAESAQTAQSAPSAEDLTAGAPPASPDQQMGAPDEQMGAPMPAQAPQAPQEAAPAQGMVPPAAPIGPVASPEPKTATVIEREVTFATLQSVNPRNFLIEPTARTIDKALGVAVEEYVGSHVINAGMRDGKYRKVEVGTSAGDTQLGADRQVENEYVFDKVHVVRYYGLVPKSLLFPPDRTVDLSAESEGDQLGLALREAEDAVVGTEAGQEAPPSQPEVIVDLNSSSEATSGEKSVEPIDAEMVEAIVFIANESVCIKAIENPYLMKDRPVVAFPWDVVPGRFWGRGVCEKGMVPQKVMDAELRARIDALAYISAPMMAMDASRLPRGFQLTVRPGKSILTNGDPNTVLRPLHFGQLEQSTFTHSQQLDQMIQRATGSLDVMTMAQKGAGDARPGAVSMMLSGIVKRHKRTLMGFIDRFYVPALRKILWRNMQYWPERYTPRNWDFVPSSTMGIIQREYESQNLVSLMSTMESGSPEYKMLLMGVVANTGLTHRHEIIEMLKQSIQSTLQAAQAQAQAGADPQTAALQTQLTQTGIQMQIAEMQAKIRELNSRSNLQNIKARNAALEPQFRQAEIATKGIYQVQADQQDREISRRLKMVDQVLKARDMASNERIAATQSQASVTSEAVRARAQVEAARAAAGGDVMSAYASRKPVPVPVPVPVHRPVFVGSSGRVLG